MGGGDRDRPLDDVLETFRAEVRVEILQLRERHERIEEMLSGEGCERTETSPRFEKAVDILGEYQAAVDEKTLEQERGFWPVPDAFAWPEGYEEGNEKLFRFSAEHRDLLVVGARMAALVDLSEDDPEAESPVPRRVMAVPIKKSEDGEEGGV